MKARFNRLGCHVYTSRTEVLKAIQNGISLTKVWLWCFVLSPDVKDGVLAKGKPTPS